MRILLVIMFVNNSQKKKMEGKLTGLVGICYQYPMLQKAIGIMIDENPEILNEVDQYDDTPLTVACCQENIEII